MPSKFSLIKWLKKNILCRLGIHLHSGICASNFMYCWDCSSYWKYAHRYKNIVIGKKGKWED